ncbi:MAG: hypothetical protein ACT4QE_17380 [Anaerolineales bacterium]
MKLQQFWDRWLLVVGVGVVAFGFWLAFANQTPLFDVVFNQHVNAVFWGEAVAPASVVSFQQFVYGVLGMTVAGWGVFFVFLARNAFKRRERWTWNCLFAGLTLWFLPDTALSAYFGVWVNVVLNMVVAALIYAPLFATRLHFKKETYA